MTRKRATLLALLALVLAIGACNVPVHGVLTIGGVDLRVYPSLSVETHRPDTN